MLSYHVQLVFQSFDGVPESILGRVQLKRDDTKKGK